MTQVLQKPSHEYTHCSASVPDPDGLFLEDNQIVQSVLKDEG